MFITIHQVIRNVLCSLFSKASELWSFSINSAIIPDEYSNIPIGVQTSHFMFNQRNAFQNNTPCQTENGSQSAMKNKECRERECDQEMQNGRKTQEELWRFFSFLFLFLHPVFQGSCKFDNCTAGKELTGNYWCFYAKIIILGLLQSILEDTK